MMHRKGQNKMEKIVVIRTRTCLKTDLKCFPNTLGQIVTPILHQPLTLSMEQASFGIDQTYHYQLEVLYKGPFVFSSGFSIRISTWPFSF